jgi:hypothetical protein
MSNNVNFFKEMLRSSMDSQILYLKQFYSNGLYYDFYYSLLRSFHLHWFLLYFWKDTTNVFLNAGLKSMTNTSLTPPQA